MKVTLLFAVLLLAAVTLTSAQEALAEASEVAAISLPVAEDQDGADLDGADTFFFHKLFRPRYSYGRSYYRPRRYHYRPRYYRSHHGGY